MNKFLAGSDMVENDRTEFALALTASIVLHIVVLVVIIFCSRTFIRTENPLINALDVDLTQFVLPAIKPAVNDKTIAVERPAPKETPETRKPEETLKLSPSNVEPRGVEPAKILPKTPASRIPVPEQSLTNPLSSRTVIPHSFPAHYSLSPSAKPKISTKDIGPPPSSAPAARIVTGTTAPSLAQIKRNAVNASDTKERTVLPPTSRHQDLTEKMALNDSIPKSRFSPSVKTETPIADLPVAPQRVKPTPAPPPAVKISSKSKSSMDDLVIINSSVLGSSDRVKNLKRDIQRKATNMNPGESPYTYTVKGYTCTLTIEKGSTTKVFIDFSPPDAPFDVVSALERILPR